MANAAVDSVPLPGASHQDSHLHADSLPLIDLRLLSQSELLSLSLCSSTYPLHLLLNDADVSTLKIDRSVFNESAGSRKQTFSRLRLAPHDHNKQDQINNRINPPQFPSYETPTHSEREDRQIISVLKSLFGFNSQPDENFNSTQDDDNLIPVPVSYQQDVCLISPSSSDVKPVTVPVGVFDYSSKRKRGRPRKHGDNQNSEAESNSVTEESNEAIMEAKNGLAADLASMEDPVEEELRRRTEGMLTKAELIEFLDGLEGEWGSSRKKRRIVDANVFGNGLPIGWKVMLCVKKRANHFWLICGRYISPNGQQFVSCKEVSSYLLSSCGLQDKNQLNLSHIDGSVQLTDQKSSSNFADVYLNDGKNENDILCNLSSSVVSKSHEDRIQAASLVVGSHVDVPADKLYKCHKCPTAFDEQDELLQHLLSSHHRDPKGLRAEASIREEVIIKNGKYECQFCRKPFEERRRFYGHLGNHIKDYFKRLEATGKDASFQKRPEYGSVGVHTDMLQIHNTVSNWHSSTVALKADCHDWRGSCNSHGLKANSTVDSGCGKRDTVSSVRNIEVQEMNNVVAPRVKECLVVESALLNYESDTIHKSPNKSDIVKHTITGASDIGGQEKCYKNCSDPCVEMHCFADTNTNQVCASLMEVHIQEKSYVGHLSAPNVERKIFSDDNIEDMLHCSRVDGTKIDSGDLAMKDELITGSSCSASMNVDVATNIKTQRNSAAYSIAPSSDNERCHSLCGSTELLTSVSMEPGQEKVSNKDFISFVDGNICMEKPVNSMPENMSNDPKFDKVGDSEHDKLTIGCCSNNTDNKTGDGQGSTHGICSSVQSLKDQFHEYTMNETPKCIVNNLCEVKKSEGSQCELWGRRQSFSFKNNKVVEVPDGAVEACRHEEVLLSDESEFGDGVGLAGIGIANIQAERNSNGSSLTPSGSKLKFGSEDFAICNGIREELVKETNSDCRLSPEHHTDDDQTYGNRVSGITEEVHRLEEVKGFCTELYSASDAGQAQQDADVAKSTLQESCSKDYLLSENQLIFSTRDNMTGIGNVIVDELKLQGGEISLRSSCSEQFQSFDNLHKFLGKIQEPRVEDSERPGNKKVLGFSSHTQCDESELGWRTGLENNLLGGFTDTTSELVHRSGCSPSNGIGSDKAESDLFGEKLDGLSDYDGLRSSSVDNMEYDFLTSQVGSHSDGPKALSYDAEMAPGFDSSVWLEKEALPLLPKMANKRHVPSVCMWCRNEFPNQIPKSEVQTGLLGFTCEACDAKFSRPFSVL